MSKDLKTDFNDACVPTPSGSSDWGGSKNGDTSFQGAKKGDAGKVDEVTFVSVEGAPKPGGGVSQSGGGQVAGKAGKSDITKRGGGEY